MKTYVACTLLRTNHTCHCRYADYVTKKWIQKRGGERRPQDRLRSCIFSLGVVIPASMLVYGWAVDKKVRGVTLAESLWVSNANNE